MRDARCGDSDSAAINAVVAAIAHAAGASDDFEPLQLAAYAVFTVFGALAAAAAWAIIRGRSAHPARLLRTLVPVVVIVSLIPDIMVGVSDSRPGASWGAVIALMVMHVAVAAVPAYQRLLPLPAPRTDPRTGFEALLGADIRARSKPWPPKTSAMDRPQARSGSDGGDGDGGHACSSGRDTAFGREVRWQLRRRAGRRSPRTGAGADGRHVAARKESPLPATAR
ncbi:DUF6069 family protein [Streptomyces europaeiscabiei]|nr:DUF6069 family protein [Streptomyces europaeiscabiei]